MHAYNMTKNSMYEQIASTGRSGYFSQRYVLIEVQMYSNRICKTVFYEQFRPNDRYSVVH